MAKTSLRLLLLVTLVTFLHIANGDGPCYWISWPICAVQKCRKDDTFLFATGSWSCLINHFCCPFGPQKNIVLCKFKNSGACSVQSIAPDECVTLAKSDWARSAVLTADCYRLYKNAGCIGPSRAVYRDDNRHVLNLAEIGMDQEVSSVSLCSENDQCPARRSKRSSYNGYNCDFFNDWITIGSLPGLSRNTSNLSGPVQWYQTGPNGRPEAMDAQIQLHHLGTGTSTRRSPGDRISRTGLPGDQAGHILASNLGGSGTDDRNIFPQSPHFNMGAFSHYVENWVARVVRQFGWAHYTVNLIYDTPTDTRPSYIFWRLEWQENGEDRVQVGDLVNPPPGQNGD